MLRITKQAEMHLSGKDSSEDLKPGLLHPCFLEDVATRLLSGKAEAVTPINLLVKHVAEQLRRLCEHTRDEYLLLQNRHRCQHAVIMGGRRTCC